ncbi:MAG: response regulator [Candidatus Omnitrophota bacterium]|jgi:CheY-like chemotaxis protein|nr:MAG: response regulator [Candidatus Omnitrophota bacterium]
MSYKVLVVDDEAPVRELFHDLLVKEGCNVKVCASGEEALELVNGEDFDVILLDIKLSGMNGLEALKKIKDIKPKAIVIMITGFGYDEELINKSKQLGCSGYIGKNMPISQIISNFKLFTKSATEKLKKDN